MDLSVVRPGDPALRFRRPQGDGVRWLVVEGADADYCAGAGGQVGG